MRVLALVVLLGLLSACQSNQQQCTVIRVLGVTQGFKVANTDSPNATIKKGGCIEFVYDDETGATHLAQSKPGTPEELKFYTYNMNNKGYKERIVFNIAGEIEYICSIQDVNGSHAITMNGRITVQP
ncbi:hypothetical protein [Meiothermus sp.]|uniref:hypothetical protein n=1 Tax=Meiothermus sp. TaxID=1955249 RepID=UPI0026394007|nr:hypothetical protein [Meiothermus sp.]